MHNAQSAEVVPAHAVNKEAPVEGEGVGKGHAEQSAHSLHLRQPLQDISFEGGQAVGEGISAVEGDAVPDARMLLIQFSSVPDAFLEVGLGTGVLEAVFEVAFPRKARFLDVQLLFLSKGQREELLGAFEHRRLQGSGNAVVDDIEKPDLLAGLSNFESCLLPIASLVHVCAEIDDGERAFEV